MFFTLVYFIMFLISNAISSVHWFFFRHSWIFLMCLILYILIINTLILATVVSCSAGLIAIDSLTLGRVTIRSFPIGQYGVREKLNIEIQLRLCHTCYLGKWVNISWTQFYHVKELEKFITSFFQCCFFFFKCTLSIAKALPIVFL